MAEVRERIRTKRDGGIYAPDVEALMRVPLPGGRRIFSDDLQDPLGSLAEARGRREPAFRLLPGALRLSCSSALYTRRVASNRATENPQLRWRGEDRKLVYEDCIYRRSITRHCRLLYHNDDVVAIGPSRWLLD
jgi:hypothetical protein